MALCATLIVALLRAGFATQASFEEDLKTDYDSSKVPRVTLSIAGSLSGRHCLPFQFRVQH